MAAKNDEKSEEKEIKATVGKVAIVRLSNAKVLDVKGESLDDLGIIHQWTWTGGRNNQQWYIDQVGDSKYVSIRSVHSGKVLDVKGGICQDLQPIIQYHYHGGNNQLWFISKTNDGYVSIRSKMNEDYCLDVEGGGNDNGAAFILYKYHGGSNQVFGMIDNSLPKNNVTIISANSQMVLELRNDKTVQAKWESKKNQIFNIHEVKEGTGKYYIECVDNNKVLDVPGSSKDDVIQIIGYKCNKTDNQLWKFLNIAPGCFQIVNICSDKVLDVTGSSKDDGAKIIQYHNNKTINQIWGIRDSGKFRIFYVNENNVDVMAKSLNDWYEQHVEASTQVADNDLYKILYVSASAGRDDGLIFVISAKAEAGVMKIVNKNAKSGIETVDVSILNAKAEAWFGIGAGIDLSANLISIQASFFYANLGIGVDTGFGIKDDSVEIEALGIGFSIGRKIGISVFGNEFGVDFGKCHIL